ncbi:hypothetical protein CYY_008268 [Polysphondylium violaceum]|uniref:EGF-like domain-containing protein n=1 Tax=Polysphondylium violaceum TaxID=133409 RepID=A0A8J4PN72_9MYCE|nr:hypothetical protein CYY_008268 [Polysphondylium violaceum]
MNKYYFYFYVYLLCSIFCVNISHALKATVVGYSELEYYPDSAGKCSNREVWVQITEFGVPGVITAITPDIGVINNSPLTLPISKNSTLYNVRLSMTMVSGPSPYGINLDFTVDGVNVRAALQSPDNNIFAFECLVAPKSPSSHVIVRPLQLSSSYQKTSIFDGYFKLDPELTKGIPDYDCQTTPAFAYCLVSYIGNGLYKATFDLMESYAGNFTLSSNIYSVKVVDHLVVFDNPLSTPQYANQKIQNTIKHIVGNGLTGGHYYFQSTENVMTVINKNFKPLNGNYTNLSLFLQSGGIQVLYMSSIFITASNFGPTSFAQLTNSFTQSQSSNWDRSYLYYMVNSFSTTYKYRMSTILPSAPRVDTSYPFGLVSISIGYVPDYKIATMFSPFQSSYTISAGISYGQLLPTAIAGYITSPSQDTTPPSLKAISIIPINNTHSVLSLQVTDDISGVGTIGVFQPSFQTYIYLTQHDLVSGTLLDGAFEKIVQFQKYTNIAITLYDRASNSHPISEDGLFLIYGFGKMFYQFNQFDITHFQFKLPTVDVSTASVTNTLYFNFTLPEGVERKYTNVQFNPTGLSARKGFESQYFGKYNPATLLYEVDFIIPAKTMTNDLQYNLFINSVNIPYSLIVSKFEPQSRMFITSSNFDQMFPFVNSIALSQKIVDYTASPAKISWTLIFEDENFVKKVIVQVVGEIDRQGFNMTFVPTTLVTSLEVVVAKTLDSNEMCIDQFYYINYIYTEDSLGNFGETFRDVNNDIHPYYKFEGATSDRIQAKCAPSISSPNPSLMNVFIHQTLDTINKVPTAIVNFNVSGIVGPSVPTCYFHSYPMDFIKVKSILLSADTSTKIIQYSCKVQLPFRYGPQVGVSIYGIIDSLGQYRGYSTIDLPETEKEFTNIANGYTGPVIDTVWRDGSKVCVTGSQLYKGEILIYVEDEKTVKLTSVDTATGVIIIAGEFIPPTNTSKSVYVSVLNEDILEESNRLLLIKGTPVTPTPTPSPTPSPSPIACSSDCGESQGYGKCVSGGCVCNPPRSGVDCKSVIDTTPVIKPDPVKPSVNVTIPGTSSGQTPEFTSFIYVYGIRELDNTDTLINNYVFNSDKWILVKEGSSSNDQVTTVQYKYLIDSYNTTIVSTVQVFDQATNVTFGNQQLYMNPSTIKFTFNITSYPFSKSTNSLQLVMTAALESTEKVACSYKEFVDDQNNSQYLKLQIEDRSLFGRFIKFGMIDGREQVVSNSILDNIYGGKELSKSTSDQSYIGLNIPYYTKYAVIDPDFSVLIEQNTARDQANSICTNESLKKLTNAQIAGIAIGGAVFLFIIVAIVLYLYTRKSESTFALKLRKVGTR